MKMLEIAVVLLFLVAFAASKMISSAATRKLDDEMKLKILNEFSMRNNYFMIAIFTVVFAYFVSIQYLPNYSSYLTVGYIVVFGFYLLVKCFVNYRKLKEIGAPSGYVRSIMLSWMAFISGFVAIAIIAIVTLLRWSNWDM